MQRLILVALLAAAVLGGGALYLRVESLQSDVDRLAARGEATEMPSAAPTADALADPADAIDRPDAEIVATRWHHGIRTGEVQAASALQTARYAGSVSPEPLSQPFDCDPDEDPGTARCLSFIRADGGGFATAVHVTLKYEADEGWLIDHANEESAG